MLSMIFTRLNIGGDIKQLITMRSDEVAAFVDFQLLVLQANACHWMTTLMSLLYGVTQGCHLIGQFFHFCTQTG